MANPIHPTSVTDAVISGPDFDKLTQRIAATTGMLVTELARQGIRLALRERMRTKGVATLVDYIRLIPDADCREYSRLIDAVVINETRFFRDSHHFAVLYSHVLPQLTGVVPPPAELRILSAGCATGEEIYSLAIGVKEALGPYSPIAPHIVGVDISRRTLARARRGLYSKRSIQNIAPALLDKYFQPSGAGYRVGEDIRRVVQSQPYNVASQEPIPGEPASWDLIFCANVLIYLQKEVAQRLVEKLFLALKPGGYLFIGYSETLWQFNELFQLVKLPDGIVYRRPMEVAGASSGISPRSTTPTIPPDGDLGTSTGAPRKAALKKPKHPKLDNQPDPDIEISAVVTSGDSMHSETCLAAGLEEREKGNITGAVRHLLRYQYLEPRDPLGYFYLGGIYRQTGRRELAAREFRHALRLFAGRDPADLAGDHTISLLVQACNMALEALQNDYTVR